jgi:hypothetical protein
MNGDGERRKDMQGGKEGERDIWRERKEKRGRERKTKR